MSSLLNKTRRLNKILQKGGKDPVVFDDLCKLLSEVLSCNVYIISRKGKVLGHTFLEDFECDIMRNYVINEGRFPTSYNDLLLKITETVANTKSNGNCVFKCEGACTVADKISTIVPIIGNRERMGTLLLARFGEEFTENDLVLAEHSTTIV
ncbi:MAG: GTP-sensing pleiotropic transcriptional regulator CodY, partial [Clostridium celatum]|nr:GTP-sensing pleiotropic transcriptional regulator CodY [Clostridium celatum]